MIKSFGRLRKAVSSIAIAAGLTACGLAPPVKVATEFNEQEHAHYLLPGNNQITGQAFLRQKGGGTVTCAGATVYLFPATSFFRAGLNIYQSGRKVDWGVSLPSEKKAMIRQSQCDADGNFSFDHVPSATWYITTEVRWTVGYSAEGGTLLRELPVPDGSAPRVLLTDDDRL